jgi:hypothetical protein
MANDLMQNMGNSLPAEIREKMAQSVADDLARLGSIGGKDAIRVTQDKKFQFPDETMSEGPLHLIVVDFVYRNEYYPGTFTRKEPVAPTCFAVNPDQMALTPTKNSPKIQVTDESGLCSKCQWDRYGSSPTGEGKACKNTVFMAVLQPDASEDSPMFVVKTSPTGIKYINQHVAKIGRVANLAVWGVITKMYFDPNVSYPSLRFDVEGPNPIIEETMRRRDEARHRLLQEPDFSTAVTA